MSQSRSARVLVQGINLYQGLSAHRPSPCRFIPSCSEYAREAVTTHGALRGAWMATRRLSRCHPLGGRGFDPVPPATTHAPHGRAQAGGHPC